MAHKMALVGPQTRQDAFGGLVRGDIPPKAETVRFCPDPAKAVTSRTRHVTGRVTRVAFLRDGYTTGFCSNTQQP